MSTITEEDDMETTRRGSSLPPGKAKVGDLWDCVEPDGSISTFVLRDFKTREYPKGGFQKWIPV